jgi:hypothetical protein
MCFRRPIRFTRNLSRGLPERDEEKWEPVFRLHPAPTHGIDHVHDLGFLLKSKIIVI